jgi:DNA-binding NtrC family response regulator
MSILRERSPTTANSPQDSIQVLLIEDSVPEARLLAQIFKGSSIGNFQLTHVQRLSEAIELLPHRSFDVALLDLTLPDNIGLASLDLLLGCVASLPIVVLTHTNDEELAVAALRRGAQDYLVKRQVNLDILVRAVRYAIERKQTATALQAINESLERRVAERTQELETANQLFLRAQHLESLGTLSSGIAHDLNNILTPILAVAQLLPLRLPDLDDRTRNLLTILESSAHRGAELIQQILSLSRGIEDQPIGHQLTPAVVRPKTLPVGQQQVILVVDDEAAIGELIRVTLETYQYRVFVAQDSTTALKIYAQHFAQIDLVLVDAIMPEIDGFATITTLQQINPQLKATLMSGLISSEVITHAEQLGCRSFLAKPFTNQELLHSLATSLA